MSAVPIEQPTIGELRALLDDARGIGRMSRAGTGTCWSTCWNERVLALNEAFGMRRTWPQPEDKELRIAILRYLHSAGL